MKILKFKPTALVVVLILFVFTATACSSNTAKPQASLTTKEIPTEVNKSSSEETSNAETATTEAATEASTEPEPFYIPDFKLKALDGTETNLYAYEGQIIVINFWATWCKYCITEMPLLDELNKRDDVTVLAISVNEDQKTVQDYLDKYDYSMPVFLDESGELASMFGVTGFPTSLFLGPDFEYFYIYPGMVEQKTLDSIFEAIDGIMKDRQ